MEKQIYKGFINEHSCGENTCAIYLSEHRDPIAKVFEEDFDRKQVSVKYWVSDKEKEVSEMQENFLMQVLGIVDAEYRDCYTEYTGYIWTTENLKIGGHNLMKELEGLVGKYVYIEVEIHNA